MTLKDYFESKRGYGVLSTADPDGRPDVAIYSKPRVLDGGTVAFIMRERLTHNNLKSNPHAAFMFFERDEKFKGIRLFLTKIREDEDPELIPLMTRTHLSPEEDAARGPKHIVCFEVDKVLPMVGDAETGLTLA
jgi:hypothetical protein